MIQNKMNQLLWTVHQHWLKVSQIAANARSFLGGVCWPLFHRSAEPCSVSCGTPHTPSLVRNSQGGSAPLYSLNTHDRICGHRPWGRRRRKEEEGGEEREVGSEGKRGGGRTRGGKEEIRQVFIHIYTAQKFNKLHMNLYISCHREWFGSRNNTQASFLTLNGISHCWTHQPSGLVLQ